MWQLTPMWEEIFNLIKEQYPNIALVILCTLAVAFIVWKFRDFYDSHKKLKEDIEKLPCEQHKNDISIAKENSSKLDDITASIRKIEEWIIRKDVKAMGDLIRKCSPYALTEAGIAMLSMSKAKDAVDSNLDYLIRLIEETNPKTAYDVEKNSLSVLTNILNEDIFNDIKDFVYNSPEYLSIETSGEPIKVEVDMNRVLMIMSIYLRDKYFEVHLEIDTKDFLTPN